MALDPSSSMPASHHIELFMFIDALGWDIVSQTHFMEGLLPYRRGIDMQFGYSCSAVPTILSGKRPAEHGHLSFFTYSPQQSPFRKLSRLNPLLVPKSFWNRGRVRHWLSKAVKWLMGFTGYFQLYQMPVAKLKYMDYSEKKDLFAAGGLGGTANLRDMLDATHLAFHISNWRLSDAQNIDNACKAIRDNCSFIFLYTAELDGILHKNILHPEIYRQKLDWYEQQIGRLAQTAAQTGKTLHLTVFSDHGMTPLTKTVDIMRAVEGTGLVFGRDYGACYDSTMCRFTFVEPGAKEKIEEAMKPFMEDGKWLSEDDEKKYGIYRADRLFGDAIFLTNPGVQIVPSDMGGKPLDGMHGFAPEDRHSRAAIMSNREIPDYVSHVADYFQLMAQAVDALQHPEGEGAGTR